MVKRKNNNFSQVLTIIIILIVILVLGGIIANYQQPTEEPLPVEDPISCGEHKAGDSWKVDCNTCGCDESGHVFCTEMACEVIEEPEPKTKFIDKCGNDKKDLSETCSSCPSDVPCPNGFSCMEEQCQEVKLYYVGPYYCGYLRGGTHRDTSYDLTKESSNFFSTCKYENSGAEKAFDSRLGLTQEAWACINKGGLRLPQFISVELPEETIINRVKVFQKGASDSFNVKKVALEVSVDSTDGKDGHWIPMKLEKDTFFNNPKSHLDLYIDPTSAKWVKVKVLETWNQPTTSFAIGEIDVFEAKYQCDSDYNERDF